MRAGAMQQTLQSLPHFPLLGGSAVLRDAAVAVPTHTWSATEPISALSAGCVVPNRSSGPSAAPTVPYREGLAAAPVLEALHHGSPVFSVVVDLRTGRLRFTVSQEIASSTLMDFGPHLLQVVI